MMSEKGRLRLASANEGDPRSDTDLVATCIGAFDQTRDTRFFFPGSEAGPLLEALVPLASGESTGIGIVTAEPGCGKTLLRTELQRQWTALGCVCATLECGWLDFDGVLLELISQLEGRRVEASECGDRYSRLATLKESLIRHVVRHDRQFAILVDEAQQLDADTMEGLRSLTNISAERRNFVSVVFFGQPEFAQRVDGHRALSSRVAVRGTLQPLGATDAEAYIRHRIIRLTGQETVPFSPEALSLLSRESRGVPRVINQHCKLALEECGRQAKPLVDTQLVEFIIHRQDTGRSWPDSCLLSG